MITSAGLNVTTHCAVSMRRGRNEEKKTNIRQNRWLWLEWCLLNGKNGCLMFSFGWCLLILNFLFICCCCFCFKYVLLLLWLSLFFMFCFRHCHLTRMRLRKIKATDGARCIYSIYNWEWGQHWKDHHKRVEQARAWNKHLAPRDTNGRHIDKDR